MLKKKGGGTNVVKQRLSYKCRKQTYGYQEVIVEGINWETGTVIYTLLYINR